MRRRPSRSGARNSSTESAGRNELKNLKSPMHASRNVGLVTSRYDEHKWVHAAIDQRKCLRLFGRRPDDSARYNSPHGGFTAYVPLDGVTRRCHRRPHGEAIFIARNRISIIRKQVWGAPDLVVEVASPGTEYRDRTVKLAWYQIGRASCRERV